MRLLVWPLVVFGFLTLLFSFALRSGDPSRLPSALIGKAAPNLDLPALEGLTDGDKPVPGVLTERPKVGEVTVVNFWASWCGPCRDEMPLLQQGSKRWHGKDVVFVGIDVKDFRGDAKDFLARYGVTYANVYDGKGSTVGRYGVTGFPETYFVDAAGDVRYRIAGPVEDAAELDAGIQRALAPA